MTTDPAVLDRRATDLIVVHERDLPVRSMTIHGVDTTAETKILSKDQSGPATRLARLPVGWGSSVPGAFTADVEIVVLEGQLLVEEHEVGAYDYVALRQDMRIGRIEAAGDVLAIVMTSAPLRFDRTPGPRGPDPVVARAEGLPWEPVGNAPGRFVRRLTSGLHGRIAIGGAVDWSHDEGEWHRHGSTEEMFVAEGSLTVAEWTEGAAESRDYAAGTYVHRAGGLWHGGPGSASDGTAITLHRLTGSETEWSDEPDPSAGETA